MSRCERLIPINFILRKTEQKRVLTMPIFVKNWNFYGRIHLCLTYPSNFLTKFGLSDVWLEEVSFRGTQD